MLGSRTANQKNSSCAEKELLTAKGETPFLLKNQRRDDASKIHKSNPAINLTK